MIIEDEVRHEITRWAAEKAFERASRLGMTRPADDSEVAKDFDRFIQEEIWRHEKRAYLKIHNRIKEYV
jgi:hypothetical protein